MSHTAGQASGGSGSGSAMALIDSIEISTAVTTHTFSGLDGNTDLSYIIKGVVVNALGGTPAIQMRLNADSGTNYGRAGVQVNTTSFNGVYAQNETSFALGNTRGSGIPSSFEATMPYAKTGLTRFLFADLVSNTSASETVNYSNRSGLSWDNSVDNITSISLLSDTANGIGVGSYFQLWAIR